MVGAGVFTTSGFMLAGLGNRALVLSAWLCAGLLAALGALSYGALARRIPESGGEYRFLARSVHPSAAFLAGWISVFAGFSAPLAAAAAAFGQYVADWVPGLDPRWTGSLLISFGVLLHGLRARGGARFQTALVLVKFVLLAAFAGVGLWVGLSRGLPAPAALPAAAEPGHPALLSAFGLAVLYAGFSYSGWNAAVYIGGEVLEPERTLPRALLGGTGGVILLYLALNAAFLVLVPPAELAGRLAVGRLAGEALGGAPLREGVTALVALALLTSVAAMSQLGPRVIQQMAGDGLLPGFLSRGQEAPRPALLFQAGIALLFLWSASFEAILTYIGITLSLSTMATVVGLVRLRRREGAHRLPVPGWPWVPGAFLLGTALTVVLAAWSRPVPSAVGVGSLIAAWLAWRSIPALRGRVEAGE